MTTPPDPPPGDRPDTPEPSERPTPPFGPFGPMGPPAPPPSTPLPQQHGPLGGDAPRCKATTRQGRRCGNPALTGERVCRMHGANGTVRRRALVRRALAAWLPDQSCDPFDALQRMIDVTAYRHAHAVMLLRWSSGERDQDGGLGDVLDADGTGMTPETWAAFVQEYDLDDVGSEQDMQRQLAALVGVRQSEGVDVGEYRRELAKIEAEERDRLAKFAALAIQADLANKRVQLDAVRGRQIADVVRGVCDALGLEPGQTARVPALVAQVAAQLGYGQPVIEGSVG